MSESTPQKRRWISLGELIALAALIVSALGLWLAWQSSGQDKPTRIVEQRQAIPLALRGVVREGGRQLEISPVESGHALQALTVNVPISGTVLEIGSDGILPAHDVQSALNTEDRGKGPHRLVVDIRTEYVEAGASKSKTGKYVLKYEWEGGGLFGGRSLRITGLGR